MSYLANVSIDLDGLSCYHRIHRVSASADETLIYRVALPRFLDMMREHGIRATLFVITSDLQHPEAVSALNRAVNEGHELASHTHTHPYNLRDWSESSIEHEIEIAEAALIEHFGQRPVGFRTPGYNVDTRILRILAERGYRYDSSILPCPPYYFAKAAVMAAMAVAGTPSESAMTDARALRAPIQPYRPSRWDFSRPGDRKHSLPLWEIPMGVTPGTRLPVIGTSIGALSPLKARLLNRHFQMGQRTLQYEFHGVDFIDASDEGIHPDLAAKQPDLRRSFAKKKAAYEAVLSHSAEKYRFCTLQDMCDELDAEAGPTVL